MIGRMLTALLLSTVVRAEGNVNVSVGRQNDLRLHLLSSRGEGKCLDGSPGGYYLRTGSQSNKFLIYFEGGGWCYDQRCASASRSGTLDDCSSRSRGTSGSSNRWTNTRSYSYGMLSSSSRENPVFHNWNLVYMPYCDGTSWLGDLNQPVSHKGSSLYFRGKKILDEVIAELLSTTSLGNSGAEVVVSGGSAGASAVYYHADYMKSLLPRATFSAAPDAGFFLDLPDYTGTDCWPNQMRSMLEVANGTGSLHKGCLERFPNQGSKCMFPEYYADIIDSRFFIINSFYDNSEMWYTLGMTCCPAGCSGYPTCRSNEPQMVEFRKLKEQHEKAWEPLVKKSGNGVWAISCITHTMTSWVFTDREWSVPSGGQHTIAAALGDWVDGKTVDWQDSVEWPNNGPCSTYD